MPVSSLHSCLPFVLAPTCSEFVSAELQAGTVVRGVRHEDLQRTSFRDNTFDIVFSSEVGVGRQGGVEGQRVCVAESRGVAVLVPGHTSCAGIVLSSTVRPGTDSSSLLSSWGQGSSSDGGREEDKEMNVGGREGGWAGLPAQTG